MQTCVTSSQCWCLWEQCSIPRSLCFQGCYPLDFLSGGMETNTDEYQARESDLAWNRCCKTPDRICGALHSKDKYQRWDSAPKVVIEFISDPQHSGQCPARCPASNSLEAHRARLLMRAHSGSQLEPRLLKHGQPVHQCTADCRAANGHVAAASGQARPAAFVRGAHLPLLLP